MPKLGTAPLMFRDTWSVCIAMCWMLAVMCLVLSYLQYFLAMIVLYSYFQGLG